jgi:hypothetical protein
MEFYHLRIARPVSNLLRSRDLYCQGLDLNVIGEFSHHDGFSGCMLGRADLHWHLEFTQCHHHPVTPSPSNEDLLVLYLPHKAVWDAACGKIAAAGFNRVTSFNPYWDSDGATFEDHDGYRVVLQNRLCPVIASPDYT